MSVTANGRIHHDPDKETERRDDYRMHLTSRPNNTNTANVNTSLLTSSSSSSSSSPLPNGISVSSSLRARASLLICGCLSAMATLILLLVLLQVSSSARNLFMPFVQSETSISDYIHPGILYHAQTLGSMIFDTDDNHDDDEQNRNASHVVVPRGKTPYTRGYGHTKRPSSSGSASNKASSSTHKEPTYNVSSWIHESHTLDFYLRYGIDMGLGPLIPRLHVVTYDTVYTLRTVVERSGLVKDADNTLIVGIVNYGYLDFALNWICFAQRLNMTNYLLAAADLQSYDELSLLGYHDHIILLEELADNDRRNLIHACGGANTHAFQSYCFNVHTQMKTLLVLTSLLAGYHTVLTDMDISLIYHPFLYMPLQHDWEMQLETNQWCTGWYYNKANVYTILMQAQVLYGIINTPGLDDQNLYNSWIHYHRLLSPELMYAKLFPLAYKLFPIGREYLDEKEGVLLHNNWLYTAGEKRLRQMKGGYYLYNQSLTEQQKSTFFHTYHINITEYNNIAMMNYHDIPRIWLHHDSLLVCDICITCANIKPVIPPLRERWPGPLLVNDFKPYRGPDTGHS